MEDYKLRDLRASHTPMVFVIPPWSKPQGFPQT